MLHVQTFNEFMNAMHNYDMSSLLCSITDHNGYDIMLVNFNQLITWLSNMSPHKDEFDHHCHTLPIFDLTMNV